MEDEIARQIKKNKKRLEEERAKMMKEYEEHLAKGRKEEYKIGCNVIKGMKISERILLSGITEGG